MIVCSCNALTDHDIHAAVDWMRAADPATLITPGKVWRALGRRADCGGCMRPFLEQMKACDTLEVPMDLRGLRRATTEGRQDEGRRKGHRVSQQGPE